VFCYFPYLSQIIFSVCGACSQEFQISGVATPLKSFCPFIPGLKPGVIQIAPFQGFSFVSIACGNSHFENLPQLLQVGEIEQLAVTLLLTIKYPAEAVIPPRINSRPAVVKNSFLSIFKSLFYLTLSGATHADSPKSFASSLSTSTGLESVNRT
jgi:hypothetical protein